MQAILYVAHGTRSQAGVTEAKNFISYYMKHVPVPIQVMSFIDFVFPAVHEGIDLCVAKGAKNIAIVPLLLLEAGHAKNDLPKMIKEAKKKYPHITFTYSPPFGVHDYMVDAIIDRLQEHGPMKQDASILLIARGSSDVSILKDLQHIIEKLKAKIYVRKISVCYLAAQTPTLQVGLDQHITYGAKHIYVVPYLLFTGLLMQHIEETVDVMQRENQAYDVHLCTQIGKSEAITPYMYERIQQVTKDRSISDGVLSYMD
ncbi:sirohydrochlorin chelatase [Pseudogracilibacillus sp. SO10305]|uniref:sirohydrochlorin chelatase n=1 Tax=Pseudogracilibacillus sp. SO10305 TaxID=3098292 RepID=UPI00300E361F